MDEKQYSPHIIILGIIHPTGEEHITTKTFPNREDAEERYHALVEVIDKLGSGTVTLTKLVRSHGVG
jgi:hypothetical protein